MAVVALVVAVVRILHCVHRISCTAPVAKAHNFFHREIIFATTCQSDTGMTDAAVEVERELRNEGHDLRVVVLSWSDLELKISQHQAAIAFFSLQRSHLRLRSRQ